MTATATESWSAKSDDEIRIVLYEAMEERIAVGLDVRTAAEAVLADLLDDLFKLRAVARVWGPIWLSYSYSHDRRQSANAVARRAKGAAPGPRPGRFSANVGNDVTIFDMEVWVSGRTRIRLGDMRYKQVAEQESHYVERTADMNRWAAFWGWLREGMNAESDAAIEEVFSEEEIAERYPER